MTYSLYSTDSRLDNTTIMATLTPANVSDEIIDIAKHFHSNVLWISPFSNNEVPSMGTNDAMTDGWSPDANR